MHFGSIFVAAWMAASVGATAIREGTSRLGLKTLILGTSSENVILPANILTGYGSPHDIFVGSQPSYAENLWHAIVIADSEVDAHKARQYAARTRARLVVLQPNADDFSDLGVDRVELADYDGNMPNVSIPVGVPTTISGVVNKRESWSVGDSHPMAVRSIRGAAVQPFLKYDVPGNDMLLAAFVSTNSATKTEEMHFMFNAIASRLTSDFDIMSYVPTESTHANLAFGHAWMEWVTRGVFLGYRRMTVNLHIDDYFHAAVPRDEPEARGKRIQGVDVENYVAWRRELQTRLPPGSDFKLEPAYNGAGLAMLRYEDNGLIGASQKHAAEFFWVSHTWTHMNLDWVDSTKTTHPTAERYDAEFDYNKKVARGEAIASEDYIEPWTGKPATPPNVFLNNDPTLMMENYSPHSLVTPEISGLWPKDFSGKVSDGRKAYPKNELFWQRLVANGMYNVVGDSSRPETIADNVYHGIITDNEQYGTPWGLIMPRFGANIPWDCFTYECLEYYQNVVGACSWIGHGPACPGELSGRDAVIREAKVGTIPLLQLRWDSWMFHQANMHSLPYKSNRVGLASQFGEELMLDVMRFVDGLPFISFKMDDLAQMYRERMARDHCDVQGTISFGEYDAPSIIEVEAKRGSCNAVLTITDRSSLKFSGEGAVRYGPDLSSFQTVTAGEAASYSVSGSLF